MILLVDLGNSRLKWALAGDGQLQTQSALDCRADDLIDQLSAQWALIAPPRQLAIASVVASELVQAVQSLAQCLWPNITVYLARPQARSMAGVCNAYCEPEKLGVDRWLAMLATHHYYPGHSCVVDCGTAITIDVLDAEGRHLGGLISPGLQLMKKALAANTDALTFTAFEPVTALADHTVAAINGGTTLAAIGLIEQVMKRLDPSTQLILCGGDAQGLANHVQRDCVVDSVLVLKGLLIASQQDQC